MVSFQRDVSQVLETPELRDSREASLAIKTIYIHFGRAEKFLKERGSGSLFPYFQLGESSLYVLICICLYKYRKEYKY